MRDGSECQVEVPVRDEESLTVGDVMRRRPRTLPADSTVGDVRGLFTNPNVLDVVLVDGPAFAGLVDREAVVGLPDETPALDLARSSGVTIAPGANLKEAMARLDQDESRRLVVVGSDGITFEGLLCLNTARTGFCR